MSSGTSSSYWVKYPFWKVEKNRVITSDGTKLSRPASARLESLEQTKLVRENCALQGKVGELEKRLEALENLAVSYLQKDKRA